jgi:CNT family concentrative nucleoside transporter
MHRLISVLGILVFIGLAWLMSSHRWRINPRIILGGLLLQFAFAALILQTTYGGHVFDAIDFAFNRILDSVSAGSLFVFGDAFSEHFFAFKVLPTIIFFSAFMSIFYYYGVMQFIVSLFARLMQVTLGTSGAETLSAAANIFVRQTDRSAAGDSTLYRHDDDFRAERDHDRRIRDHGGGRACCLR